jgi:hypothetical protein
VARVNSVTTSGLARNGAHEIPTWLAVVGSVAPVTVGTLAYAAAPELISGMTVLHFDTE